jgi:mono/diheme cytochrome c family protein
LSVVGAVLLAACAASPYPHATAADVAKAQEQRHEVTLEQMEQGRSVYLSHCGQCHQLPDPKSHAPGKWPQEVAEMKQRAKLSDEQGEQIVAYLVGISSRN